MLYNNKVKQRKISICLFIYSYFIQTLTTLVLSDNKIGSEGTKYLAHALDNNKVRLFFLLINF
jgi:Ran GTPase-activating protein (RanGAP) involved in mRNA processing and transport